MCFTGPRKFCDVLLTPHRKDLDDRVLLFICLNTLYDLKWQGAKILNEQPGRENLQSLKIEFNSLYKHADHQAMISFFPGWPSNTLEEWAIDYNNTFMLDFDVFYSARSMESIINISVYGDRIVDWKEYSDSYGQSQIMHKLKQGIPNG